MSLLVAKEDSAWRKTLKGEFALAAANEVPVAFFEQLDEVLADEEGAGEEMEEDEEGAGEEMEEEEEEEEGGFQSQSQSQSLFCLLLSCFL